MKAYIKLIIEGVTVGLPLTDLPFLISYRIADEVGQVAGSSTDRFIDLPASKETNNLYQQYKEIASNNKSAIEYKETVVTANGVPLFSGTSQLQRAVLSGKGRPHKREVSKYKVALFGQNANWLIALKGLKLSDLDFTDATFDSPTVQAGWNASYDSGDFFGFCLAKWKSWNNETGGTTAKSSVLVELEEFTPFLFVRSILERIFDKIGYGLESNLIETERFKSLVFLMPPIDKYPQEYSDDFLNTTVRVPNLTVTAVPTPSTATTPLIPLDIIKQPPLNPLAWNPVTSTYTVLVDCFAIISATMEVTAVGGNAPQNCLFGIKYNGSSLFLGGFILGAFGTFVLLGPPGPTVFVGEKSIHETGAIPLFAGDTLQVEAYAEEVVAGAGTLDLYGTIDFKFEAKFGFGQNIVWEYLLKDYTALDFINGLTDIHNLKFENDQQKRTLRIEPRNGYKDSTQLTPATFEDGFYLDTTTTDYTEKLDFNKDAQLERLKPKKNQLFKWATDGDTEQAIEEGENKGIYQANYILQDNTFIDKDNTKEVRFWAKTIHINDNLIQSDPSVVGSDIAPLVPLIFPQNYQDDDEALEANFKVKPRIMHFMGQRGGVDGYIQVDGVGDIEYPACFFVNYNDLTGLDPSLSFANETINSFEVAGLLDTFYIHEMVTLSNAKRLKDWLVWSNLMLNKLTFRDTILLDSVRYIIEEIQDKDPTQEESVKTVLMPHVLAKTEDLQNIDNTLLKGVAILFP